MNIFPFILTLLAGLSTVLGAFFILFNKDNRILVSSLAFASSVMLSVSFLDLIPESVHLLILNTTKQAIFFKITVCILMGLILAHLVNKCSDYLKGSKLYKVGIISMLAIILHNIPEGIATFMAGSQNVKLGLTLAIAIGLHNIPEGITIAVPIYYATGNKKKAFLYTLLSGLSEFLGALITAFFLKPYINDNILGLLFSIIAGIMIYIAIIELLPTALKYHQKRRIFLFFIIGIIIMIINSTFF